MTTAERLQIVDVDVHESPRNVRDLLPYLPEQWHRNILEFNWSGVAGGHPWAPPIVNRAEWKLADGPMGSSLEKMRSDLFDGLGVSLAVICGNPTMHFSAMAGWHEFAQAMASAYNDFQIEHWLEQDDRLRGSVHVVAHDPVGAAREIDRVGAHPRMVQVFLPLVSDRQYGDPQYEPIFEAASRHGLAVALHHGSATHSDFGARFFIEFHTVSLPHLMAGQVSSMLFNGVFDRHLELRVIGLETGVSWLPGLMRRADRQYMEFRHEVPWVRQRPSDLLRDHVRISTQPFEEFTASEFSKLTDLIGSEEVILFSSDYPHHDADDPAAALPAALPEGVRRKILCTNALATYPRLAGLRTTG